MADATESSSTKPKFTAEQIEMAPEQMPGPDIQRGVKPSDTELSEFSSQFLDLKRSIGEHKAEHFAVADVPVGDLVDISEFLSDLADLKLDARVAALQPK